jgi:hypothetical protein
LNTCWPHWGIWDVLKLPTWSRPTPSPLQDQAIQPIPRSWASDWTVCHATACPACTLPYSPTIKSRFICWNDINVEL